MNKTESAMHFQAIVKKYKNKKINSIMLVENGGNNKLYIVGIQNDNGDIEYLTAMVNNEGIVFDIREEKNYYITLGENE